MSQDDRPRSFSHAPVLEQSPVPGAVDDVSRRYERILLRFVDPEWLLFLICLLVPALVCAVRGDSARSVFFARLALYIGFLKWLGWAVLTRPSPRPRSFLLYPHEMIVGLSLPLLWFYLRNVVGLLFPGPYSLFELGVAAWLAAVLQLAGGVALYAGLMQRRALNAFEVGRGLAVRSVIYLPFVLTLTLTLWSVSKDVFVPSQDGWFHSFIARVFLNDGLFYRHFNGNDAIFYSSGFGALNAVTAAISGLTVVQAHNLQHILVIVTGVLLLSSSISLLAQRVLAPLHLLAPLVLSAYPLHNLPPDLYWTHTPQQAGSALLVAIPLVSLVLPAASRITFYSAIALQSLLSLAVLALSPVCAFFLPAASLTALGVNCVRGRTLLGDRLRKVFAFQAAFTMLAGVLVLGADRYYSAMLLNPAGASYMRSAQFGGDGSAGSHQLLGFSPRRALMTDVEPMLLMPDRFEDPKRRVPGRFLPWLAVMLVMASCGFAVFRWRLSSPGSPGSPEVRHLTIAAAVALVFWIATKYWASFVSAGITSTTLDALLLQQYLLFMARRLELWLLLISIFGAATALYLVPRRGRDRVLASAILVGTATTFVVWWIPLAATHLDPRVSHLVPQNVGVSGRITRDDIELTRWMERNLPPGGGIIGLTSMPFKLAESKLLFPIDAGQALSLYGKQYNFCFQLFDPSRKYSYDDYTAHVVNYFDADWCVKNDIRYFHVPSTDIYPNHGLARAREVGLLEPIRAVPSSAVYSVRPLPWTPRIVPGPTSPESSHHVSWQADGRGVIDGDDPSVVFNLGKPVFVHAIRFKYTLTNPGNVAAASQLFWKSGDQPFVEHERNARLRLETSAQEQSLTILVHDTLETFRFDPDSKPGTFSIRDIELLVKPAQ
jgi:hypothetical protein